MRFQFISCLRIGLRALSFGIVLLLISFTGSEGLAKKAGRDTVSLAESKSETLFLDRLMTVESGGRLMAKNPRSTALGPFQFVEGTFLEVVYKYFPELASGKTRAQVLALRTRVKIARSAALVYTRQNAVMLSERGIKPIAANLRLAFLIGVSGASRIIRAKPESKVSSLLSPSAIEANPFLRGMTAKQLILRSKREVAGLATVSVAALNKMPRVISVKHPEIKVRCNLRRASCRKWLHLAKLRLARRGRY